MNARELPNGNLLVPKHPNAPGPAGDEAIEIGPEHPDYERWLPEATARNSLERWRSTRTATGSATSAVPKGSSSRWPSSSANSPLRPTCEQPARADPRSAQRQWEG